MINQPSEWVLKNEIGVSYCSNFSADREAALSFPISVEYCNNFFLFVEEVKRGQFCTRCVNRQNKEVFNSLVLGMGSYFGCLLKSSQIILLSRARGELSIFNIRSGFARQIDISAASPCSLRFVKSSFDNNILLLAITPDMQNMLFEIDLAGNVRASLNLGSATVSGIASVQKTRDGNYYLIADSSAHVVKKLSLDGKVVWQYGRSGHPGSGAYQLSNPSSIVEGYGEEILISDTRNHRVILTECNREGHRYFDSSSFLCSPTWFATSEDGAYCVADAGNQRIIEINGVGRIVWQLGSQIYSRRVLSFPRSVEPLKRGGTLIADTCNDRIIAFDKFGTENWSFGGNHVMSWPRCARQINDREVVVSDSLQSRMICVHIDGVITKALDLKPLAREFLPDVHDFKITPSGLLLVDTPNAQVLLVSWERDVYGVFTHTPLGDLKDPHSVDMRGNMLAIADTGNSRIIILDLRRQSCSELRGFARDDSIAFLNMPRGIRILDDRRLIVVDTGNNRVLIGSTDGRLLSCVSTITSSPITKLAEPRSAHMSPENSLLISDYYNHRILELVLSGKDDDQN